jgi:hypothetical protein
VPASPENQRKGHKAQRRKRSEANGLLLSISSCLCVKTLVTQPESAHRERRPELCRLSAEVFCFFVSQLLHLLDHATLDRFGELFDGGRFENAFHVKVDLECVLNSRYETHREERVPAHSEKVVVDSYRWEFQKPEPYFREGSLREIPRLIHSCISGIWHGAI